MCRVPAPTTRASFDDRRVHPRIERVVPGLGRLRRGCMDERTLRKHCADTVLPNKPHFTLLLLYCVVGIRRMLEALRHAIPRAIPNHAFPQSNISPYALGFVVYIALG